MESTNKTSPERAFQVAQEIINQISRKTFFMLGAKDLMTVGSGCSDRPGLMFRIRGSKTVNHITVLLDPDDTYTLTFSKIGREYRVTKVSEVSGIYVDSLHHVIEKHTGLCTRL